MGVSTWGSVGCNVDEKAVLDIADSLVQLGLRDSGYTTIQIDDCWSNKSRSASGEIQPNSTKFPRGMKFVAEYVNAKGFDLGIYTDIGEKTCAGYPGARDHWCQDAQTFVDWGIRYVKMDFCYNHQDGPEDYGKFSKCLNQTGVPVTFGLCSWGSDAPWTYAPNMAKPFWFKSLVFLLSTGPMRAMMRKSVGRPRRALPVLHQDDRSREAQHLGILGNVCSAIANRRISRCTEEKPTGGLSIHEQGCSCRGPGRFGHSSEKVLRL